MTILYFDETNNHRVVSVSNGKLNIPDDDKDFVLGGIGLPSGINLEAVKLSLISSMGFNHENLPKDIKLKTLAQGGFLDCLKSNKLKELISEIKKNNLLIHYFRTNIAFWSTLDIIESLLADINLTPKILFDSQRAKEELLNLYKEKKSEFLEIFEKYSYPNITSENVQKFYAEVYLLCRDVKGIKSLKKFLKIGTKSKSAIFLQDNTPLKLIEDFSNNYIYCIEMHRRYNLVFDHEVSIKDKIDQYFSYKKLKIDYRFMEKDFFLQISDVIVGLLGKLYFYANKNDLLTIKKELSTLNPHQLSVLSNLKEIMTYTQNFDPKLGFETAPASSVEKQKFIINFKKIN